MKSLLLVSLVVANAGSVLAQDVPPLHPDAAIVVGNAASPAIGGGFGTSTDDVSVISWSDFFPRVGGVSIDSDAGATGTRWITAGPSNFLYARLPLENGVLLGGFDIYYRDASATDALNLQLCRYWRDTVSGTDTGASCVASFTSAGSPGDARAALPVPPQFGSILYRANVDGDPEVETVDYVVIASLGSSQDGTVRIAQVRPYWRRQVSAAPLVATFPNDVPTTHPFFRFIEALAASGITAGCAAGSYCPDNPVTRGEMAVFLAAALGLHFNPF
jgi:hypothetical protein